MLAVLRRSLNTWPVRLFFLLLVLAFMSWGVGDVVRNLGQPNWVAKVGDQTVGLPELQAAYQRQLAQLTRMLAGRMEPTPEMRRSVAMQAAEQLVMQAALAGEADRLGLVVPDDALRDAVFAMPAFHGPNGQFDRPTLERVLRDNGYTEARFLDLMRADLAQRQLMGPVHAGAVAPDLLVRGVFAYQQEKRVADLVELLFANAPAPAEPSEAALQRWYDNHPDSYSAPEYRKIKAVILSPETLAKDIDIPEADLRAAYEQNKARYVIPEKRSVEVLLTQDEAVAQRLAAQWRAGADWAAMQAAATQAGASPVALDDATRVEIPSAALAAAAFAATPDQVPDPVHSDLGWHVLRVTKVTPGSISDFDAVKDALRAGLAHEKAGELLYERITKVEDALAGGARLDELPGDLGLAAVTGTLDAKGNTREGTPAPIPGPAELRSALIASAFRLKPGDSPHLTEVPGANGATFGSYAVVVEEIIPPARKPFETVRDQVRADWTRDAVRRSEETAAAQLLTAVKGGQSLADAATIAGVGVRRTAPIGRQGAPEGVPSQLVQPLFGMKQGEATMVETPDGFVVAVLAEIQAPDPAADPLGFGQMRDTLARGIAEDTELAFATALRDRAKPQINATLLDSVVQP